MFSTAYLGVAVLGLVHGLEPGHGWPLAIVLAQRRRQPYLYGAWAALVLGLGHMVSSFFVVGVFIAFDSIFDFSSDIFRYLAGAVLILIGVRFWFEKGHEGSDQARAAGGLKALVMTALLLGFAHEEEFALLGLAVGGLNPLAMMGTYAVAVLVALIAVTLVGMAAYLALQKRAGRVFPHLTKVSAIALVLLGLAFLTGLY